MCVLTKCATAKCSEILALRYYCRSTFVWCHLRTGWFLCIPPIDTVWKTGIWVSLPKNNTNDVNAFMNGCSCPYKDLLANSNNASPHQDLLCSSVKTTNKCVFSMIKHFKPLRWQMMLYNPGGGGGGWGGAGYTYNIELILNNINSE